MTTSILVIPNQQKRLMLKRKMGFCHCLDHYILCMHGVHQDISGHLNAQITFISPLGLEAEQVTQHVWMCLFSPPS